MPSPLEEQVEKLAWEWGESAKQLEALARSGGDEESAAWVAGASAAREEDIDDLRALLPLEVTDEMVEAGAKALWASRYPDGPPWEEWWEDHEAYLRYSRACLSAALTQPQTERCPEDCDGFGRLIGDSDGPCPACSGLESDGGGAATAAGVADADLEGIEVHINGSSDLSPEEAEILGDAMKRAYVLMKERQGTTAIKPTPYAKAFRERVCPVPEFPSVEKGTHE